MLICRPVQVTAHRGGRTVGVVLRDRGDHRRVLDDDPRHAPWLRKGQQPIAVDLRLHVLHERPDSRIAADRGDRRVKRFVGLVELRAVARGLGLALAFENRAQAR